MEKMKRKSSLNKQDLIFLTRLIQQSVFIHYKNLENQIHQEIKKATDFIAAYTVIANCVNKYISSNKSLLKNNNIEKLNKKSKELKEELKSESKYKDLISKKKYSEAFKTTKKTIKKLYNENKPTKAKILLQKRIKDLLEKGQNNYAYELNRSLKYIKKYLKKRKRERKRKEREYYQKLKEKQKQEAKNEKIRKKDPIIEALEKQKRRLKEDPRFFAKRCLKEIRFNLVQLSREKNKKQKEFFESQIKYNLMLAEQNYREIKETKRYKKLKSELIEEGIIKESKKTLKIKLNNEKKATKKELSIEDKLKRRSITTTQKPFKENFRRKGNMIVPTSPLLW